MGETKRHKMVGWYDPFQLARTGYEVIVSAMFGKHADKRVIQAIADTGNLKERIYHEIKGKDNEEYWFDYVSDVGDGFDSTYTVAYHLSRPDLKLAAGKNAVNHLTKRGELLIFGGDEVYPTAGAAAYAERLVFPYCTAFPKKTEAQLNKDPKSTIPPVFAIPGNHDWYDSLATFMNLFCRGKSFCGWKTYQNRSYFALKLPKGWWLFGTDMQLSSSLDDAQMDYFSTIVRKHMREGERIILCNAEPYWITDKMYRNDPNYNNRNMGFFEGHILDHRVAIHLAGDRHYYRRHEELSNHGKPVNAASRSKIQRFVAGGGGAFLHPTHREGVDQVGRDHLYELKTSYPSEKTSFCLTLWNLLFPIWNLKFGLVTGFLYILTAQAFKTDLSRFGLSDFKLATEAVMLDFFYEPTATFWIVLILLAFYFFTDTHSKHLRWVAGPVHAIAHFFFIFIFGWTAAYWFNGLPAWFDLLLSILLLFTGGYIVGSWIMGVYVLIALNIFGIHHNEAFSALKIEGYKNFLRFKIDKNGDLTVYPIGIEAPIKDWKDGEKVKNEPKIVPQVYPLETKHTPFLIEEPVLFAKPIVSTNQEADSTLASTKPVQLTEDAVIARTVTI